MILADKIIKQRKKNGWSQEELAEKMNVSRQSVSKWEAAQSIPDLEKILKLADLFGVTTDYLLKDEIETEEFSEDKYVDNIKRVSLEEANEYLDLRKKASIRIALGVLLCIISPVTLILFGGISSLEGSPLSEVIAGAVGLGVLLMLVLSSLPLFIYTGFKNDPYVYLDKKEPFELEYGVRGIVEEHSKNYRSKYVTTNIIATCLCVFSAIPLVVSSFSENEILMIATVCVLFFLVALGVFLFIAAGVRYASMQKLLKEGEYAPLDPTSAIVKSVGVAYWGVITAVFLMWTFLWSGGEFAWVLFVFGGALFPIVKIITRSIVEKHKK